MDIKSVSEMLNTAGFGAPSFHALIPDVNNYKVILFQPHGEIEASAVAVRNRDRDHARKQFFAFLGEASERSADLAVTPEYSLPWEVLTKAIKDNVTPASGKLWALGCESIRYSELQALQADLSGTAEVMFESLTPDPARFVDPLAYIFRAPSASGETRLVVLIQFKTRAMGDPGHFEINNLQRGNWVYELGGGNSLRLLSLICSDAFGFTDAHARAIYDRALVIHIQLNPEPRHAQYRLYRDKLLGFHGDATELLCLNWAECVSEWSGAKKKHWNNVSASAWYLRPDKYDSTDDTLCANHRRGLYYTWFKPLRFHALFLNYRPGVFIIDTSKVAHLGVPGAISRRRGPQLTAMLVWDDAGGAWVDQPEVDDGFRGVTTQAGCAQNQIEALSAANPLYVERLLALSAGQVECTQEWHCLQNLDSCAIEASEVIRRMTFCQDRDGQAAQFRIARLKLFGRLTAILNTAANLPPSLNDFADGFDFDWSPHAPHQNARTDRGVRATVIYMGEQVSRDNVEAVRKRLAEFLQRGAAADEGLTAKQRLAIWFQENGQLHLFEPNSYVKIDQSADTSEFDIGREA
jgi:hypothetical protein